MEERTGRLSEFAIVSLVLGIVSFLNIFNLEKPLLAIVFGAVALYKISQSQGTIRGKGFALAGLVLGVIAAIVIIVVLIRFFPKFLEFQEQLSK